MVEVRFPSLKYNSHRRFCYVQFKSSNQAERATGLDGIDVGERLRLQVKISDPNRKQERSGALYEEREIYVSNVDWNATEDDLRQIFSKYGGVERVHLPRNLAGKSKGYAFIAFTSKVRDERGYGLVMLRLTYIFTFVLMVLYRKKRVRPWG